MTFAVATGVNMPNASVTVAPLWRRCEAREVAGAPALRRPRAFRRPDVDAVLRGIRSSLRALPLPAPALPWLGTPTRSRWMAMTDAVPQSSPTRPPVDPAIVAIVPLAAAGDEIAFTRLVGAFHADMARVAYVVCGGDRELTEDAVQSAWTIAWSRLGTLRDPQRIRSWLLSVTANEARQFLRRQRRVVSLGLEFAEERLGESDAPDSSAMLDMEDVLARLKPEERTLVALRYAAGLDSAEIGAVLGMSASGVRSRLDRLLDRLRAELEHD